MKISAETLAELRAVKQSYQKFIRDNFEFAARDCRICLTPGACCTDAHFVNVHITPLEAAAIRQTLENKLTAAEQQKIRRRVRETIERYDLKTTGDTFAQTFACPIFEPNVGCLVHGEAKPLPCVSHACYERAEDLPPACLQENAESKIEKLNREIYADDWRWLPLPVQLSIAAQPSADE